MANKRTFIERGATFPPLPPLDKRSFICHNSGRAVGAKRGEEKEEEEEEEEEEGSEERQGNSALGGTEAPAFLSQSDLFRLVAASMRGHSNLAIFARANLKKHERLTRAKMLLITRPVV